MIKKAFLCSALVLSLMGSTVAFAEGNLINFIKQKTYTTSSFQDVSASDWYYPSIKSAFELGLIGGKAQGVFDPKGMLTLAEAVAIASRVHNIYYGGDGEIANTGSNWYEGAVSYAIKNGIIRSTDFIDYSKLATRAQMAYIFASILEIKDMSAINSITKLPDVMTSTEYSEYIFRMYNAGIIRGSDEQGTFKPSSNITRAETVAILKNLVVLSDRKIVHLEPDTTTKNENAKFPPLFIQGYRVEDENYHAFSENDYKVKAEIFDIVGYDFSSEMVKEGFIDVEDYALFYKSKGVSIGCGINGDGVYILYRQDQELVQNENSNGETTNYTSNNGEKSDGYAINLIREYSDTHFDGKHVGSNDNKDLAYMLYNESNLLGAKAEIMPYNVNVAESSKTTLKVNGNSLVLMKDYMPNGAAKTAAYKGDREVIYIGAAQNPSNYDVNGKAVIFTWNDINGKFPSGLMDRYLPLFASGATEVFIIANGEMPIGYFEHPLGDKELGYIQYISVDAAKKYFDITDLSKIGQKKMISLEYDFVKKIESKTAYNVIATVPGVVNEEIVLITNYDGWGHIGDINYTTVAYDTIAPVTMLRLIDYYIENKPYYTLKFAFTGDKWTAQKGMDALLEHLSKNTIKTFIDIYALGGSSEYSAPFIVKNIKSDVKFIERVSTDFGNALSNKITQKGYPSILVRGKGTEVGDVTSPKQDTFENYNINKFNSELDYIKNIIDQLDESYTITPIDYAASGVDVNVQGKIFKNVKTKFIDVYYNETFVKSKNIDLNLLNYIDEVFLHISKFNHYTKFENKIKFYIDESSEFLVKSGLMWNRQGDYHMPYADDKKESIYSNTLVLANFAHEVNHVVNHIHTDSTLGVGNTNNQIDEVQGKSFLSLYLPSSFTNSAHTHAEFLKKYNEHFENGTPLIVTGQVMFDFRNIDKVKGFTYDDQYYNSDQIEGTIVDFIVDNYGYNKARSFVMKAFSTTSYERYSGFIEKELGLTYNELISEFNKWYKAKGEYKINIKHDDNFTDYDYELFDKYSVS